MKGGAVMLERSPLMVATDLMDFSGSWGEGGFVGRVGLFHFSVVVSLLVVRVAVVVGVGVVVYVLVFFWGSTYCEELL
jgi:hypothetical protein